MTLREAATLRRHGCRVSLSSGGELFRSWPTRYRERMSDQQQRRNPWWAVALVFVFGGFLSLVAGRMLPWQDQDRRDPDY